jgi:hypothetical protein
MILIRIFLIGLIVYLIIRPFLKHGKDKEPVTGQQDSGGAGRNESKKIPKSVGEYVDFEELDKNDS